MPGLCSLFLLPYFALTLNINGKSRIFLQSGRAKARYHCDWVLPTTIYPRFENHLDLAKDGNEPGPLYLLRGLSAGLTLLSSASELNPRP